MFKNTAADAMRSSFVAILRSDTKGNKILISAVEVDPRRRGGVPVLRGTRFTVAQTLAELSETSGVAEVADKFDLDPQTIKDMLNGLSLILMERAAVDV